MFVASESSLIINGSNGDIGLKSVDGVVTGAWSEYPLDCETSRRGMTGVKDLRATLANGPSDGGSTASRLRRVGTTTIGGVFDFASETATFGVGLTFRLPGTTTSTSTSMTSGISTEPPSHLCFATKHLWHFKDEPSEPSSKYAGPKHPFG